MPQKTKRIILHLVFFVLVVLIIGVSFSYVSPKLLGIKAATTSTFDVDVTVGNATPTVSGVELTPNPITVTDNTTTTVTCTATINDGDGGGDITAATGTIYRSGVGYSCTGDDNNCYPNKTCSLSAADGNNKYATCTTDIWFHAEPTDDGDYFDETWQCYVIARDNDGVTATNTDNTSPELNTLSALTITSSLDYGTLGGGATSSQSSTTTVTSTGNIAIDVRIKGTDMTFNSFSIPGGQQEYATSSVDYGLGTDMSTTTYVTLALDSLKPVQHNPIQATATDDIYWRIGIPAGQQSGTYYGTTTVAAIPDCGTTILNNLFNGTGQGFTGGSQANGGVEDYNNAGDPPSDRYSRGWTQCTSGNNYCDTGLSSADVRDDSTNLIFSLQCNGSGCSSFSTSSPLDYTWDSSGVDNNSKTASQLCSSGNHGQSGWSLPHQKQLIQAYIDGSYGNLEYFGDDECWSATTRSADITQAWTTDLNTGFTTVSDKTGAAYDRCVRCVRSAP